MKTLINTFKVLTLAIDDLKKSIYQLNDYLTKQDPQHVKKTLTQNNSSENSFQTYSSSYVSEKEAVERIYKAFTEEGIDPVYHKKMSTRLKNDWPNLYSALYQLTVVKMNTKSSTSIWKYSK